MSRKRGRRPRYSHVSRVHARCQECAWQTRNRKNGMANAAQHHDRTGHRVQVTQEVWVAYGHPKPPQPGGPDASQ